MKNSSVYSSEDHGSDVEKPLLASSQIEEDQGLPRQSSKRQHSLILTISVGLFVLSAGLVGSTWYLLQRLLTEQSCLTKVTVQSPLLESVSLETVVFNNSFAQASKYRGPPTPELEAEWDKLWNYGDISVPESMLPALTVGEPETTVWRKVPDTLGDGYLAGIEVFHQLHCLNMIRQYTWGTYYERHNLDQPTSLRTGPIGSRMHVDHCIETLRMTLMCHGDTTPMLREVDEDAPLGGRAWFSTVHKCANFEALQEGMQRQAVVKDRALMTSAPMSHSGGHSH